MSSSGASCLAQPRQIPGRLRAFHLAVSLFLVVTRPSTGEPVAQLAIEPRGAVFAEPGLPGRHRIEPGAILHASERAKEGHTQPVGTRFEVMQVDDHLRLRVREGRGLLHAQNDSVPVFEIENRPLTDFLAWVGRETGRRVTFVDARAHEIANHTTLHGSVQGLRPMDALDQVLSTTSLRCEVKSAEIRIASRGQRLS